MARRGELDRKIKKLNAQIRNLRAEKKALMVERKSLTVKNIIPRQTSRSQSEILVEFLKSNPRSDREEIRKLFSDLSEEELTNLITRTRRNHLIMNEGTRTRPRWIAIEPREHNAHLKRLGRYPYGSNKS